LPLARQLVDRLTVGFESSNAPTLGYNEDVVADPKVRLLTEAELLRPNKWCNFSAHPPYSPRAITNQPINQSTNQLLFVQPFNRRKDQNGNTS